MKHKRICLLNLVLVVALAVLAVSCQSMKELGENLAEYNRLVTQPEYLEQRWKEVVAEWKKETAEQNLGLSEAKTLLHQHLSDNHLLSLSSNHEYGNANAEHREWIAYVRDHFQVQAQLKKWRETLPRRFSIREDRMEAYIERFLINYRDNFVDTSWELAIDDLRKNYLPSEAGLYEADVFDIAAQYLKREQKAAEEKFLAEQKALEEKRLAERKAAEEKRLAERKATEEKRLAEQKAAEERKAIEVELLKAWRQEVVEMGITETEKALERLVRLCGDKDEERGEKYYNDFGNFDRLQREAMASWDEIKAAARKTAHDMFLEMCQEPSFVYPATDICDSSVKIYQDFKSGMSYSYVSGMDYDALELNKECRPRFSESITNGKWYYSIQMRHPIEGKSSSKWPHFYYARRNEESTNGILIGMETTFEEGDVPIKAAMEKYSQQFGVEFRKEMKDGSLKYIGENKQVLVTIYPQVYVDHGRQLFGDDVRAIVIKDLAQIDAYNKLYLQREAERKKAAEEAAKAKADELLNF